MAKLLDQLYADTFRAHPMFEVEVRPAVLKKVHDVVTEAVDAADGRVRVPERPVRELVLAIANPLGLGIMGGPHFALGHDWKSRLDRLHAQGGEEMTVGRLRRWLEVPQPMGLPAELQNLIILTYAGQSNSSFMNAGVAATRCSVQDMPMGPKVVRSTTLSAEEEAVCVVFRRHTLLPLDDCLYALQATVPQLTRSSLHRLFQRHGISRLPEVAGDPKKRFASYSIGYFRINLAEVCTEEGKLRLFVAVDRTSKLAFVRLVESAGKMEAAQFRAT